MPMPTSSVGSASQLQLGSWERHIDEHVCPKYTVDTYLASVASTRGLQVAVASLLHELSVVVRILVQRVHCSGRTMFPTSSPMAGRREQQDASIASCCCDLAACLRVP